MAIKIVLVLCLVFTLFMALTNNSSARELLERDCLSAGLDIEEFCVPDFDVDVRYGHFDDAPACCKAFIKFVSLQCEPSMLTSVGYMCNDLRNTCQSISGPAPSPMPLNNKDVCSDWK